MKDTLFLTLYTIFQAWGGLPSSLLPIFLPNLQCALIMLGYSWWGGKGRVPCQLPRCKQEWRRVGMVWAVHGCVTHLQLTHQGQGKGVSDKGKKKRRNENDHPCYTDLQEEATLMDEGK